MTDSDTTIKGRLLWWWAWLHLLIGGAGILVSIPSQSQALLVMPILILGIGWGLSKYLSRGKSA